MGTSEMDAVVHEVVGALYPEAIPASAGDGWLERRWVVRTRDDLPPRQSLERLATQLTSDAVESSASQNVREYAASKRVVELLPATAKHCIVIVRFPGPEASTGDEASALNWGVLCGLDARIAIEDLQGLPRRFWFFLDANSAG